MPLTVYGSVEAVIRQLDSPSPVTLAKAALALRLAAQLDLPEEGKGIAAVARELRFLLVDLAAGDAQESVSRLDLVLERMGSPS